MGMDRKVFFDTIRYSPFHNLNQAQVNGLTFLLDTWEAGWQAKTPLTQFAYILGTTWWESGQTMQPIHEHGKSAYFTKMYDPLGQRPSVARRLGNTQPGDGVKFAGMGYVQSTGRGNARKATKRLRELKLIPDTVDFEQTPELLMKPEYAVLVLFIGFSEGWWTGDTVDREIDPQIDGDEHADFLRARRIVNGTDRAAEIANASDSFLLGLKKATLTTLPPVKGTQV